MKAWKGAIWACAALMALGAVAAQPAFAADEASVTTGKVVASGEKLTVKPAEGDQITFWVKWIQKKEKWIREPLVDIALRKTLRKGVTVTVNWSIGEMNRKYIDKLIAEGTITGTVVEPRKKGILLVAVEGIDGPMRFVSRWINPEGKWIPDPKEVEMIAAVPTGAKVSVTYELEEHLRINELKVVE